MNHLDEKPSTSDDDDKSPHRSSCIIKIDAPVDENDIHLIDGDSIEQVIFDEMNSSIINQPTTLMLRSMQLDAIVEDSNEESSDEFEETSPSIR